MTFSRLRLCQTLLAWLCAAVPLFASQEKVLYTFNGPPDGSSPQATLIADKTGKLYGTTQQGGTGTCIAVGSNLGCGTVFELSPPTSKGGSWTETVLYSFQDGADGSNPIGGLVMDATGNLYGTTWLTNSYGQGTVFELSPPTSGTTWTLTTLHTFHGSDGAGPEGTLIFDSKGNLFGTTVGGGSYTGVNCVGAGCGTVFELSPPAVSGGAWTEAVLHAFTSGSDGAYPYAGLVMDVAGNLYGTTYSGGKGNSNACVADSGCGTVFELHASGGSWTEHILHSFNFTDGHRPVSTLAFHKGVLYGTTSEGQNYGSIFELVLSGGKWTLTSIFTFNENDGAFPMSGVAIDSSGNLFGSSNGGPGNGLYGNVYELSPPTTSGGTWGQTILYNFPTGSAGGPVGGLLLRGNVLYGTTTGCSDSNCSNSYGTVIAVIK